jgi:hypothetical protein
MAVWLVSGVVASPAGAQAGRDGCYFGECPGGRPAPSTTAQPTAPVPTPATQTPPPRPRQTTNQDAPTSPTRTTAPADNAPSRTATPVNTSPSPQKPPRTASGPKIGGNFCGVITDIADLAGKSFKPVTGERLSKTTRAVKRSLPGADACGISIAKDGQNYVCVWELEPKQMKRAVESFVETVSNCFDGADTEDLGDLTHRISATDDADIIIAGDIKGSLLTLMITQSADDGEVDNVK